ncbi:MAG: LLM class F420-dependent oxidoreductase [Acidimicrobiales bacterium]|nr:LLM class F420-dependent oxidoreductase [Acidimicrobiales bacterium]
MRTGVRLGVAFPQTLIGGTPSALESFARQVEARGFSHLVLYDHLLGADRSAWPDLVGPWRADDEFHDVFVMLGFLAAMTSTIELSTQVLVLPQRQAGAVARQAASAAQLSGNRLRLGVGVGWNPVEFQALGANFTIRGRFIDEQLEVVSRLLTGEIVTFQGRWHTLDRVAINPVPHLPIPIWVGGTVTETFERVARYGDGWITLYDRPGDVFDRRRARLGASLEAVGRDPGTIGVDAWVSMGGGRPSDWRREVEGWVARGVTHLTLNTGFRSLHHQPIDSHEANGHIDAALTYFDTVKDLLCG